MNAAPQTVIINNTVAPIIDPMDDAPFLQRSVTNNHQRGGTPMEFASLHEK